MIAPARISNENDLGLAVTVEVLARMTFVENHAKPSRAKHYTTAAVVDCGSAVVAVSVGVARRTERNLVAVPKFLCIGSILRRRDTRGGTMTGDLACQIVLCANHRHKKQNEGRRKEDSSHAKKHIAAFERGS